MSSSTISAVRPSSTAWTTQVSRWFWRRPGSLLERSLQGRDLFMISGQYRSSTIVITASRWLERSSSGCGPTSCGSLSPRYPTHPGWGANREHTQTRGGPGGGARGPRLLGARSVGGGEKPDPAALEAVLFAAASLEADRPRSSRFGEDATLTRGNLLERACTVIAAVVLAKTGFPVGVRANRFGRSGAMAGSCLELRTLESICHVRGLLSWRGTSFNRS